MRPNSFEKVNADVEVLRGAYVAVCGFIPAPEMAGVMRMVPSGHNGSGARHTRLVEWVVSVNLNAVHWLSTL